MIVFLDTEFTDFIDIDLISIGLVSEDGKRSFYAERIDYRRDACSDFVGHAVEPLLGKDPAAACTRDELCRRLVSWLSSLEGTILLACDSQHDIDLLLDAVDGNLPPNVKARPLRLANHRTDPLFNEAECRFYAQEGIHRHHALHDAQALRAAWLGQKG